MSKPLAYYGPTVRVEFSCAQCVHCESKSYAVQGDSGHEVQCTLAKRYVGDTTWRTPTWCPYLDPKGGK